jgi:hypothetical protein
VHNSPQTLIQKLSLYFTYNLMWYICVPFRPLKERWCLHHGLYFFCFFKLCDHGHFLTCITRGLPNPSRGHNWMVVPLTLSTSCAFTCTIPFLDGILRWKPTNPPCLSNSPIGGAHLLLATWWDGESHPQSAPLWVPWAPPIGAPFFGHFLGYEVMGSALGAPFSNLGLGQSLE